MLAASGAAELLLEAELTPTRLLQQLRSLLGAPDRLGSMSAAARALAREDAAEEIARMVRRLQRA